MVGLSNQKNHKKESTSSASPLHPVHSELYLPSETLNPGTNFILRSQILSQYFSHKPNIYLWWARFLYSFVYAAFTLYM